MALLGFWEVGIFKPRIGFWKFNDKATKTGKEGAAFRCLLVDVGDPSQYVRTEIVRRSQDMKPLHAIQNKFLEGKRFRMTAVRFRT